MPRAALPGSRLGGEDAAGAVGQVGQDVVAQAGVACDRSVRHAGGAEAANVRQPVDRDEGGGAVAASALVVVAPPGARALALREAAPAGAAVVVTGVPGRVRRGRYRTSS